MVCAGGYYVVNFEKVNTAISGSAAIAKLIRTKGVVIGGVNKAFKPLKRLPIKNVLTKMKTGTLAVGGALTGRTMKFGKYIASKGGALVQLVRDIGTGGAVRAIQMAKNIRRRIRRNTEKEVLKNYEMLDYPSVVDIPPYSSETTEKVSVDPETGIEEITGI